MSKAFYMEFITFQEGMIDKIGGLPCYIPPVYPCCPSSGEKMVFLAQFQCSNERLNIEDCICVQLYQCADVDNGESPFPVVVRIPPNATKNVEGIGRISPQIMPHGILWREENDPDGLSRQPGYSEESLLIYKSKAGGDIPFSRMLETGSKPLLMLNEEPGNFNFGGLTAVLYLDCNSELQVTLL